MKKTTLIGTEIPLVRKEVFLRIPFSIYHDPKKPESLKTALKRAREILVGQSLNGYNWSVVPLSRVVRVFPDSHTEKEMRILKNAQDRINNAIESLERQADDAHKSQHYDHEQHLRAMLSGMRTAYIHLAEAKLDDKPKKGHLHA